MLITWFLHSTRDERWRPSPAHLALSSCLWQITTNSYNLSQNAEGNRGFSFWLRQQWWVKSLPTPLPNDHVLTDRRNLSWPMSSAHLAVTQGYYFKRACRRSKSWSQEWPAHEATPLDTNYYKCRCRAGSYLLNWDRAAASDAIRSAFHSFLLLVWFTRLARLQRESKLYFELKSLVCFMYPKKNIKNKIKEPLTCVTIQLKQSTTKFFEIKMLIQKPLVWKWLVDLCLCIFISWAIQWAHGCMNVK